MKQHETGVDKMVVDELGCYGKGIALTGILSYYTVSTRAIHSGCGNHLLFEHSKCSQLFVVLTLQGFDSRP